MFSASIQNKLSKSARRLALLYKSPHLNGIVRAFKSYSLKNFIPQHRQDYRAVITIVIVIDYSLTLTHQFWSLSKGKYKYWITSPRIHNHTKKTNYRYILWYWRLNRLSIVRLYPDTCTVWSLANSLISLNFHLLGLKIINSL